LSAPEVLPLLPLNAVLFPAGLMHLTVVQTSSIELLRQCHRERRALGALWQEQLAPPAAPASTQPPQPGAPKVGVMAEVVSLVEHDAMLRVTCSGGARFRIKGKPGHNRAGLWSAYTEPLDSDPAVLPAATMFPTVQALGRAIAALRASGELCMNEPFRLDDAGWVANRWCELLPIAQAAKQRLMVLPDPAARLALVDVYLRERRVVA
jgi:uncharacterized protein